jgi:hypothetical protein
LSALPTLETFSIELVPPRDTGADRLRSALEELVERAPRASDLVSHRIGLVAACIWRDQGRPVPLELAAPEREAWVTAAAARAVLERIRSSYDGRIVLVKGPELAARYPDPRMRGFSDLDLLVDDAEAAQEALLAAGFEAVGDAQWYVGIHHLRPLVWRGLPLPVEIHSRPKWVDGVPGPSTEELLSLAVPGLTGVEGISTLPPEPHALLLAAHSWAHEPLRRLRDLIDVAVMTEAADRAEVARLADAWGLRRLWRTTSRAADAVLFGCPPPWPLRLWAQNLQEVRERTVLESHFERWLSDYALLSPLEATRTLGHTLRRELLPEPGESWRRKLARTAQAMRNAGTRRSEHDEELERRGRARQV